MGPAWKKAHIVSQPTIEEEPEEEVTGEVVAMGDIVATGEPAVEVATDKDTTMEDAPAVALVAEAGPSAEMVRMMGHGEGHCGGVAGDPVGQHGQWVHRAKPGGNRLAQLPGDVQTARVFRSAGAARDDDHPSTGHLGGSGAHEGYSGCAG